MGKVGRSLGGDILRWEEGRRGIELTCLKFYMLYRVPVKEIASAGK
jgi:hypothetical protein